MACASGRGSRIRFTRKSSTPHYPGGRRTNASEVTADDSSEESTQRHPVEILNARFAR
jgi:hypothetical protein